MAESGAREVPGPFVPEHLPAEECQRFALWAEALGPVIRLHDREADSEVIEGLWAADFPAVAAVLLEDSADGAVAEGFARVLAGMPRPVPPSVLDELAADFADGYLTHGFRAAPTGSVWLTEDHLERQQPMFDVRDWYAHYGLRVPDWRIRSDDHIVHELQFVAHLLALGTPDALTDAAAFMDSHLLPWAPDFCVRIAAHARHPFHAGAALLTRALLAALRSELTDATGRAENVLPHAWAVQSTRSERQAEADRESPFVPGFSEGW
jgi:TorA maturation chaperone TorD